MSVLTLLNKTCSRRRPTASVGSVMGSTTYSYATTTGIRCKVDVKTAKQDGGVFRAGEEMYFFYFAYGTDIQSADELTSVTGYTDYTFTVQSNPQDTVGRGAYTKVLCKHVTGKGAP